MSAIVVQSLGFLALVALGSAFVLGVSMVIPRRMLLERVVEQAPGGALGVAWAVSVLAMTGSLYFSDGMGLEPCKLCWFQRIAMYPLVVVLGVALVRREFGVWRSGLPLALIGAAISAYHVAVQWQPNLQVTECSASAPCSLRYFTVYGFVSIPVMAGSAFLLIAALLVAIARIPGDPDGPWDDEAGDDDAAANGVEMGTADPV